jgi:hypothetical protein
MDNRCAHLTKNSLKGFVTCRVAELDLKSGYSVSSVPKHVGEEITIHTSGCASHVMSGRIFVETF